MEGEIETVMASHRLLPWAMFAFSVAVAGWGEFKSYTASYGETHSSAELMRYKVEQADALNNAQNGRMDTIERLIGQLQQQITRQEAAVELLRLSCNAPRSGISPP